MKPGFLDDYISSFEHLRHLAGWGADDAGTVMLFKKGLTQGLHRAVLEKTTPHPTTLRGWMEATHQQYELWAQIKASLGGSFGKLHVTFAASFDAKGLAATRSGSRIGSARVTDRLQGPDVRWITPTDTPRVG